MRYTVQLFENGNVDLNVSKIGTNQQTSSSWIGKTYFFMRGAEEMLRPRKSKMLLLSTIRGQPVEFLKVVGRLLFATQTNPNE